MEPIFENRFISNHQMLTEYLRKYMIHTHPVVVVIFSVMLTFLIIQSCLSGILIEMLPMLLFMAVVFTVLYFMPDWFAWMSCRNVKKQNDGVIPESVITFGETIELHEGMVHYTIEYRKVIRVVHLKHSYVLMIGKRNGVMLDPDGFTKGTFEEFKQFLREKRPDLSIPE